MPAPVRVELAPVGVAEHTLVYFLGGAYFGLVGCIEFLLLHVGLEHVHPLPLLLYFLLLLVFGLYEGLGVDLAGLVLVTLFLLIGVPDKVEVLLVVLIVGVVYPGFLLLVLVEIPDIHLTF